jgi:hypothetical protein
MAPRAISAPTQQHESWAPLGCEKRVYDAVQHSEPSIHVSQHDRPLVLVIHVPELFEVDVALAKTLPQSVAGPLDSSRPRHQPHVDYEGVRHGF